MAWPTFTLDGQDLDVEGCWRVADPSSLFSRIGVRGDDVVVAQRYGVRAHARIPSASAETMLLWVFGENDPSGVAHTDKFTGLSLNLDELYALTRPKLNTLQGTVELVYNDTDIGARAVDVHILRADSTLQAASKMARAALDVLPVGLWRDVVATSGSGSDPSFTVANPGTADQLAKTITISGSGSYITLTNPTWGDQCWVSLTLDISAGDVVIDTGAMTVTQGGASVLSALSHRTPGAVGARWLPLVAKSDNTIGVDTDGTLTVTIEHYARYL